MENVKLLKSNMRKLKDSIKSNGDAESLCSVLATMVDGMAAVSDNSGNVIAGFKGDTKIDAIYNQKLDWNLVDGYNNSDHVFDINDGDYSVAICKKQSIYPIDEAVAEYAVDMLNRFGGNKGDNDAVSTAIRSLSFSELTAVKNIIKLLTPSDNNGLEGTVISSKVADELKITRSVIVNALRKLGASGFVTSRSLGMKGTHIKISSNAFVKEIQRA